MTRKLKKFVDSLPIMNTLKPLRSSKNGTHYEVTMKEFHQKLHRDLPPTKLWGYQSQYPGPTIEVGKDELVNIQWINQLPRKHFLPVDTSIHHLAHIPEVRTVTHVHGASVAAHSDGYPEAWYTRNYEKVGPSFERKVYQYTNHQRGTALWYHDHAMGITRLNVYAGLAGMYIIRDKEEQALRLPQGEYEIPLIIQDRTFNNDGSLFYPKQPANPADNLPDPSIQPFFIGDTIVVNGKVWPYLEVEPRKYRFRILNGSNTRAYTLYLDSGQSLQQIGSDGGLFSSPVSIDSLEMEPAVRADIIIDFSAYKGQTIHLKNNLGENSASDDETDDILQFRVRKPLKGKDNSRIPKELSSILSLTKEPIRGIRNLKLVGTNDKYNRPLLLLNNKMWSDPITEKPIVNTTEIWSFMNITRFSHPIHIHLVQFQILDRRPFDLEQYNKNGTIQYTGPSKSPAPNERGWHDTVTAPAGEITRVIMKFSPYTGHYVWHCHILEHEDYDMMRPLLILPDENKD